MPKKMTWKSRRWPWPEGDADAIRMQMVKWARVCQMKASLE